MESLSQFAKEELVNIQKDLDVRLLEYMESEVMPQAKQYHLSTEVAMNAYKEIVVRGGKRLRGAFVLKGYELFKGRIDEEIYKAAMAIEMMHAYILVIDDFNDRSDIRRKGPTAHKMVEKFHTDNQLKGDSFHFGISEATVAATFVGQHVANSLLLSIDLPKERVIRAVQGFDKAVRITGLGQIRDIYNQTIDNATEMDVLKVHEYKTSVYTYLNPLQLGATLAGASEQDIEKLKGYSIPAGIAFQIQDDILGMFGDPKETGKSNKDDLMEGKITLLITKALENVTSKEREIIMKGLGNRFLTDQLHKQVQEIIVKTGSLEYSKELSFKLVKEAKESLSTQFKEYSENNGFKFILGIADYMIERKF
ncbi:polyprenyl synthetase family protein [Candidatus Dojkabacteria bacterium]|nr:polyprenyl synthetase family protein [Candidatus Dojkabacteria bacterium]